MQIDEINIDEYELIDIESLEKTDKTIKMNDIQVEDNETFFLSNGIMTHNSAIAKFTEIRDPEKQAGMPLRGKVLNVYNKAPIDAMENKEVEDIITAINLEFNEQMGDWVYDKDSGIFDVEYESVFEVDDDGNPLKKTATVTGDDRFLINKKWIQAKDIYKDWETFSGYIQNIEKSDKAFEEISHPDYFHFRRLWDYRGFRKNGVKYRVKIGRSSFVCNDVDEIKVDGEWFKVTKFLNKNNPKTKQDVEVEKVSTDTPLPRFHKLLKPSFESKLEFGKVYIATDADPDGSAINNLLLNLFHEYFPELFWDSENPFVNRIVFPMISAKKNKKVKYYANRRLYDEALEKGEIDNTWKIQYFKGLGTMNLEDWEHVFSNLEKYSFKIYDDGHLDELMQIFFDSDPSIRKEWLATK